MKTDVAAHIAEQNVFVLNPRTNSLATAVVFCASHETSVARMAQNWNEITHQHKKDLHTNCVPPCCDKICYLLVVNLTFVCVQAKKNDIQQQGRDKESVEENFVEFLCSYLPLILQRTLLFVQLPQFQ